MSRFVLVLVGLLLLSFPVIAVPNNNTNSLFLKNPLLQFAIGLVQGVNKIFTPHPTLTIKKQLVKKDVELNNKINSKLNEFKNLTLTEENWLKVDSVLGNHYLIKVKVRNNDDELVLVKCVEKVNHSYSVFDSCSGEDVLIDVKENVVLNVLNERFDLISWKDFVFGNVKLTPISELWKAEYLFKEGMKFI